MGKRSIRVELYIGDKLRAWEYEENPPQPPEKYVKGRGVEVPREKGIEDFIDKEGINPSDITKIEQECKIEFDTGITLQGISRREELKW